VVEVGVPRVEAGGVLVGVGGLVEAGGLVEVDGAVTVTLTDTRGQVFASSHSFDFFAYATI
jgi:hypothetical protein